MESNKDKENPEGRLQNTFITIISVLIYIANKLANSFIGFVKWLAKKGIINCILAIIGAFILIMLALILWPYILTPIIAVLCLFGLASFGL